MNSTDHPSAVRSRNEFAGALLKLMERYPYNEISVKQIVLETDLVRKTFYRNFTSKDDVLLYITRKVLKDYFRTINSGEGDVLTVIFRFADKNRRFLKLLDKPAIEVKDEKFLFEFIKAAFSQRRKTLVNCIFSSKIVKLDKEEIGKLLVENGFDEKVRGETLSLEQYGKLADAFLPHKTE